MLCNLNFSKQYMYFMSFLFPNLMPFLDTYFKISRALVNYSNDKITSKIHSHMQKRRWSSRKAVLFVKVRDKTPVFFSKSGELMIPSSWVQKSHVSPQLCYTPVHSPRGREKKADQWELRRQQAKQIWQLPRVVLRCAVWDFLLGE